ncbi:MAG: anaerobic ribonucleoside-triphosphate reductase activating protein [Alphaproteobacteria bacterium]|nr:anaerobic ribonucleoside-triphosphate reductase activating protein [Alphaproteobacteria bacterium]
MKLRIGGIEPFTTVDFPGRLAAVIFFRGCPLRCPYCHNSELQEYDGPEYNTWEQVLTLINNRKGLLDGVVFSGGEPLMQPDLLEAMKIVKSRDFEIGLHTSGISLKKLNEVLPLISWIGFDIKTGFENYNRIPGANAKEVESCLDAIIKSGVEFECRTTLDPNVIKKDELLSLATVLKNKGVKIYALQEFRPPENYINPPSLVERTAYFNDKELISKLENMFDKLIIRRA